MSGGINWHAQLRWPLQWSSHWTKSSDSTCEQMSEGKKRNESFTSYLCCSNWAVFIRHWNTKNPICAPTFASFIILFQCPKKCSLKVTAERDFDVLKLQYITRRLLRWRNTDWAISNPSLSLAAASRLGEQRWLQCGRRDFWASGAAGSTTTAPTLQIRVALPVERAPPPRLFLPPAGEETGGWIR